MNRVGEILKELVELNTQAAELNGGIKTIDEKRQQLTQEWQGLCSHPEEYVDIEFTKDYEIKMCRACNKVLAQHEITGEE